MHNYHICAWHLRNSLRPSSSVAGFDHELLSHKQTGPSPCHNLIAWHVHGSERSRRPTDEPDQPCLCDVKIEVPSLFGFHVSASGKESTAQGPMHEQLLVCGPSLSWPKRSNASSTPGLPGHPLCIDPSGALISGAALCEGADGYKTHVPWRFCWLGNFYAGLWNVYALLILEHCLCM